jgi:hypothetical protein
LAKETDEGWANAENIYRQGAYTKPVAILNLHHHLTASIPKDAAVIGVAVDGTQVSGTVLSEAKENEQSLKIEYDIGEVQEDYVNCQVGANPSPITDGCK